MWSKTIIAARPEPLSHPKYRPDIDGLRAVAVLAVVVFHAFPAAMPGGFVGVDIFFVISGFLISTIILENLQAGRFSFPAFYARRIRRILPALLLVLAACLLFGWFTLLADEYRQLGKHMAGSAAFISNFLFWNEAGYFDQSADSKPLLHLWSLAIEEQFYIFWPLILWAGWKLRANLLLVIVGLAALSFALNIRAAGQDTVAAFYAPQTRFWELLLGGLLAWLQLPGRAQAGIALFSKATRNTLSVAGAVLTGLSLFVIDEGMSFPGWAALLPTLGAVLLLAAGADGWVNRLLLARKLPVWIGLISYPLYMWHWPLLSFSRIMEAETPSAAMRLTAISVSLLLAALTYKLVERPIRFGRAGQKAAVALFVLLIVAGIAGLTVYLKDGVPWRRFAAENAAKGDFDWPEAKNRTEACVARFGQPPLRYCVMSTLQPPTIALIGDSHANALFEAFDAYFAARQRGVIMLGEPGCPPFLGVERDRLGCPAAMQRLVEYLMSKPEITDVYIAARFAATESGIDFGGPPAGNFYRLSSIDDPGATDRRLIFRNGLAAMLKALAGKSVTIMLDVPELSFDPRGCLAARRGRACDMDVAAVTERQAAYTAIIMELQKSYPFRTVDPKAILCNASRCVADDGGQVLYRDPHHLNSAGSRYLLNHGLKLD